MFRDRILLVLSKFRNYSDLNSFPELDLGDTKVNVHEQEFTEYLLDTGFVEIAPTYYTKKKKTEKVQRYVKNNSIDTIGFVHEPNGDKRTPDFRLYAMKNGRIYRTIDIELKSTRHGFRMMMNDGWFHQGMIYVMVVGDRTRIMMGEDIPTRSQTNERNGQRLVLKKMNRSNKETQQGCSDYYPYNRKADQYSVSRHFDKSFEACFDNVCKFLETDMSTEEIKDIEIEADQEKDLLLLELEDAIRDVGCVPMPDAVPDDTEMLAQVDKELEELELKRKKLEERRIHIERNLEKANHKKRQREEMVEEEGDE